MVERNPDCGHVFVLHCDTENIAADAILIPGNPGPKTGVALVDSPDERVKLFEAADMRGSEGVDGLLFHCRKIVTDFLTKATAAVGGTPSKFKRVKPLLALPMLGTGRMDPDDLIRDESTVVREMLPMLYTHANSAGVDVALCTVDLNAYYVVQSQRARFCPFADGPFWMLSAALRAHAERLAADAHRGALSLFFGAGASYPSGLPSWGGLLADLAETAGFSEAERAALKELDYLDQPTLIEERMGPAFRPAIADAVRAGRYTPTHAILAELRVPAATTNYDDLFEAAAASAAAAAGDDDAVLRLPWASAAVSARGARAARPLTKLHGCVSRPGQIVLTRADYMRYEDDRRAVRGLVHHMLLASNIVFVGFSMTDTNLHKIIDEVREALGRERRPGSAGKFGTITALVENDMFRQLWDQDFEVLAFGRSWADSPAWFHDCFFDCVAALAAAHKASRSFILNPKYSALLSEADQKIADALEPLVEMAEDPKVQASPVWEDVQALLKMLGLPEEKKD